MTKDFSRIGEKHESSDSGYTKNTKEEREKLHYKFYSGFMYVFGMRVLYS